MPASYQKYQCNEWAKIGLQGVSVLFASGNSGIGSYPALNGFDKPETGCLGQLARSLPYVGY